MYGMIHQAARKMVHKVATEEDWATIVLKSGLAEEHFVSGESFDDETTFALIGAIQAHMQIPVDELLQSFGEYWVEFAAETSFGGMLKMAGADLVSLLTNLDRMHVGIAAHMPDAAMPSFKVLASSNERVDIRYQSERTGLECFVVGLLHGLMNRFGESGEITYDIHDDGIDFVIDRTSSRAAA